MEGGEGPCLASCFLLSLALLLLLLLLLTTTTFYLILLTTTAITIIEEHLVLYDAILRYEEHFEQAEEGDGSPRSFTEERLESIQSIYDNFIKDGQ
jgi:hypothetical protein